jgi:hypothetical protein
MIGFLSAWIPMIGVLALVYQLGQLVFDVRVFPLEWKIEHGNSIEYTALKLSEIGIGYVIGLVTCRHQTQLNITDISNHIPNH